MKIKPQIYAIVLNWNEKELTEKCVKSLKQQSQKPVIVIVDNGSIDGSFEYLSKKFPNLTILRNKENLGFSGGENTGIRYCMENGADYIVLLNNDAVVEKNWIEILYKTMASNPAMGVVSGKLLKIDGKEIDSTGDQYSSWGLPIARQRNQPTKYAFSQSEEIFGGTAGASMYRSEALADSGLFDEKFFAYYEDTDLNFRLQLAGWKALYQPKAVGYHAIGGTSSKLSGFTTVQTTKNLPMLFFKNVPIGLMPRMLPKFFIAYNGIMVSSLLNKRFKYALKGMLLSIKNIPHTIVYRHKVQSTKKVSDEYIWSIIYNGIPPDAYKLRRLRSFFTKQS